MKKKVKVKLLNGLHARPATQISIAASKCPGDVMLTAKGQRINAKSVLSMLTLSLSAEEELEIESEHEWVIEEIEKILASQKYEQAKIDTIDEKPKNLEKFIKKKIKRSKKKIFFSTETFSKVISESVENGQKIDPDKIFEVNGRWCIDGAVPELIHALGVDDTNSLEILSGR